MPTDDYAELIRVKGLVQGVGFRPTVWRLAIECGLQGEVGNDGEGVFVRAWGEPRQLDRFCHRLQSEPPPLARIERLERNRLMAPLPTSGFKIIASQEGEVHTGIVPDAATCEACRAEIVDPTDRRYRYPFTNCTHCGPRLSIVQGIPYDRVNTSMRIFTMCDACRDEYETPTDRRFHAQPNACPVCGPQVWMEDRNGDMIHPSSGEDAIQLASRQLGEGRILAVKGIGGFHLACDATNAETLDGLRHRKGRYHKPFALMARDLKVVRRYCHVSDSEAVCLQDPAAPIVLLERRSDASLPDLIASGQPTLGFMLPYSPLHQLLLSDWERPLVMTSANLSEEPQCISNQDAKERMKSLADGYLLHEREIVNRVDDSVLRWMNGAPRLLRRARGYAPRPLDLPEGFTQAEELLALGGELKNTFCLLKDGQAILSQHLGDLENQISFEDFKHNMALYRRLYGHRPVLLVGDLHPGYRTTRYGRKLARERDLEWHQVQHHHAHIASVMAENRWPLEAGPVLGIALDGSGYGPDGTIWGGEFLLADYRSFHRLGMFRPVPLPGGPQAILQPWRNSFAQLHCHFGWDSVMRQWGELEPLQWLDRQPLELLSTMLDRGINSPMSSSCGRLFDALAGLLGICRERISYEGQAAIELEAAAVSSDLTNESGYPFALTPYHQGLQLDPSPCWRAVLADLQQGVSRRVIAARFHLGLADAVVAMAVRMARSQGVDNVALSGGVFQNRTLFERVDNGLRVCGLQPLTHRKVPTNDGGLSLGQAIIAAARRIKGLK